MIHLQPDILEKEINDCKKIVFEEEGEEFEKRVGLIDSLGAKGEIEKARELFIEIWVDGQGKASETLKSICRAGMNTYNFSHYKDDAPKAEFSEYYAINAVNCGPNWPVTSSGNDACVVFRHAGQTTGGQRYSVISAAMGGSSVT